MNRGVSAYGFDLVRYGHKMQKKKKNDSNNLCVIKEIDTLLKQTNKKKVILEKTIGNNKTKTLCYILFLEPINNLSEFFVNINFLYNRVLFIYLLAYLLQKFGNFN